MSCHFCLSLTKLFPHNPFFNLPIRPHYRSMQPCWLWTPSRSSTVDFPTLGKQNISLLSLNLLLYFLYSNRTWEYNLSWLFSVCEVVEMWHIQLWAVSLSCHQVFTGCWGFTEANRRSECNSQEQSECFFSFFFSSFMFSFSWTCKDAHISSLTDDCTHADALTSLFLFPSSLPLSLQASVNTELVRCLSRTARGTLPPLAAAVGGLASQEVLKAITGKFAPLQQWVSCWIWTVDLLFRSEMVLIDNSIAQLLNTAMGTTNSYRFY